MVLTAFRASTSRQGENIIHRTDGRTDGRRRRRELARQQRKLARGKKGNSRENKTAPRRRKVVNVADFFMYAGGWNYLAGRLN